MSSFDPPLRLKIYPDPALREVCEPVEHFNSEITNLVDEMHQVMRTYNAIGLAAPQVGFLKRLFICELESHIIDVINPRVKNAKGHSTMAEGCLSIPGVRIDVNRFNSLFLVAYDTQGQRIKFKMTGIWARIVQHEQDHLNGVLICDHAV